ncbi:calcium uniporter protein 2, mitochondrial [Arachis stenosperma]|uniref:calcium uniporter protein 2, mitochondrial n=1 Tax=Arachis stenosperma TaxID=217475 RepID=UPI0025ACDA1D|nr:calcium uniporter protein 2, mitochondrial [Arachis stenosperma]
MAFKKTLAQRLFNFTKLSSQTLTNCRISSASVHARVASAASAGDRDIAPDPGDNGVFRRFLHKRPGFEPELRSPSAHGNIMERLRAMDIARNRIRLEGLRPPEMEEKEDEEVEELGVTAEDARKLLKAAQVEMVKSKLKEIRKSCITLHEFIRICSENCSDQDQAVTIARLLDDSAAVIILGDVVFVRPEQVAKAIQDLLPLRGGAKVHDSVRREFEEMEKQKSAIDGRAHTLVRRELWGGLSFLVVQTLTCMRLTFWELTWDVMEPICFYLTSVYFMAGYTFFLRTSIEPSFEGFYQSRFSTKQKRLMKLNNFDIERFNELKAACSPPSSSIPPKIDSSIAHPFDKTLQQH